MARRREPSVARVGWQDWYREFRLQASQVGVPPEEYAGPTGQGDEYVASLYRDGVAPRDAVQWVKDRQERRARGRTVRAAPTRQRPRTHNEVDFAVDDASGRERTFKTFDEAAGFAVSLAASGQPSTVNLDVLVWSEDGAEWYGGSDAVDRYNEDPEASVFDRLEITVNYVGRVP